MFGAHYAYDVYSHAAHGCRQICVSICFTITMVSTPVLPGLGLRGWGLDAPRGLSDLALQQQQGLGVITLLYGVWVDWGIWFKASGSENSLLNVEPLTPAWRSPPYRVRFWSTHYADYACHEWDIVRIVHSEVPPQSGIPTPPSTSKPATTVGYAWLTWFIILHHPTSPAMHYKAHAFTICIVKLGSRRNRPVLIIPRM